MQAYNDLTQSFTTWLQTLGFADGSVKGFPRYVNELLGYLQEKKVLLHQLNEQTIQEYFLQWKKRKNKRTGAGLSQSHINTGITAIHNFIKFLNASEKNKLHVKLEREKRVHNIPPVLTQKEIQQLYEATHHNHRRVNQTAYGQRDRALLAIYYGCGLRKNEGKNLLVQDILLEKKLVLVRKGKNNKERFVPLTDKGLQDIEEYLYDGRNWFLEARQKKKSIASDYFFINAKGQAMQDFSARLRLLAADANLPHPFTLHTFRHSIATHLLQNGMHIEQIKKFLGHASLESTQLYTHIVNEL